MESFIKIPRFIKQTVISRGKKMKTREGKKNSERSITRHLKKKKNNKSSQNYDFQETNLFSLYFSYNTKEN